MEHRFDPSINRSWLHSSKLEHLRTPGRLYQASCSRNHNPPGFWRPSCSRTFHTCWAQHPTFLLPSPNSCIACRRHHPDKRLKPKPTQWREPRWSRVVPSCSLLNSRVISEEFWIEFDILLCYEFEMIISVLRISGKDEEKPTAYIVDSIIRGLPVEHNSSLWLLILSSRHEIIS